MTELTRRSFLAGAAAVATAPVVGTAHAKDTKVPRPDVKADYPAAGKHRPCLTAYRTLNPMLRTAVLLISGFRT